MRKNINNLIKKMKNYKFVLKDIKKLISETLSKEPKTGKVINEAMLLDIIFLIENKTAKDKTFNIQNGTVIYVDDFKRVIKHSKPVIDRHIKWLLDNKIIWRSKLAHEVIGEAERTRLPYRYDIHFRVNVTNYDRFVYLTLTQFNKLDELVPVIDTITKVNVHKGLNAVQIDLEGALETIYHSIDMSMSAKIKQSFITYQIAFKKFTISQKKSDRRIFHTLTRVSSELHKHLYLNGCQVFEIDAKQSQLVLLSLLTKDIDSSFYNDVHTSYIYDNIIVYYKQKLDLESINIGKTVQLKYYNAEKKITEYVDYNKITKKIIKPVLYAAVLGGFNSSNNPVTDYFKIKYPKLVQYINDNFDKEGNTLASKLQKLEASIWLSAFNKLAKKNIITIPKHDALLFKRANKVQIINELLHQFKLKGLNITRLNIAVYLDITDYGDTEIRYFEKPTLNVVKSFDEENVQPNTDLSNYTFIHKDGRTWSGIKTEFTKVIKVDIKNLNKVINGKRKSISGWKVIG